MFNLEYFNMPPLGSIGFFVKERCLYNELSIYNDINSDKRPLSINDTLLQIENHFQTRQEFKEDYVKRKSIAPVWKTALSYWIYEIEKYLLGIGADEASINLDFNTALIHDVYSDITKGIERFLYEYAGELIYEYKNGEVEKKF